MIAFESMLVSHAEAAGIKTPPDEQLDVGEWDQNEYPHFAVFCTVQLCRSMQVEELTINPRVIAAIPDDRIRLVTINDLRKLGVEGI